MKHPLPRRSRWLPTASRLAAALVLALLASCDGSPGPGPGDVPAADLPGDLPDAPPADPDADAPADLPGDPGPDLPAELPGDPGPEAFPLHPDLPPLPLRVSGRFIVDAAGNRVRLQGVNWNGGHQERLVPEGLDHQTPKAIAARLREMGFNSVRLTYSDKVVRDDPVPQDAFLAANPALQGQPALRAFDAVVEALAAEGILVILNNHMSDAAWCCSLEDGNALWYNDRFSEQDWIASWRKLARRWRHVGAVVGADLRNEPRYPAAWGDAGGAELDWASAAERGGRAVLEENPDLLVFVEGVGFATDLTGVAARPVDLPADRLAYSAHDYPWSIPGLAEDYDQYAELVQGAWGYLMEGPAPVPVWLGEFGTAHDALGQPWWEWVSRLAAERSLDWSLWLLFAYDGATWGLLDPATLEPADAAFWTALQKWMAPAGGS